MAYIARVISGRTRGNAVPIIVVFKDTIWTVLQTIFRPKCSQIVRFAYTISQISVVISPTPAETLPWCLDPDTNFGLARQRSHCSCFAKRPLLRRP